MGVYLGTPNTAKVFDQAKGHGLRAKSVEMQGWRKAMEDAKLLYVSPTPDVFPSIFAVFDGHGGLDVSNLASQVFIQIFKQHFSKSNDLKQSLYNSFLGFDQYLKTPEAGFRAQAIRKEKSSDNFTQNTEVPLSGSTACVVAIYKDVILCANAGDSRAVVVTKTGFTQLSFDHKPQNPQEKERIEAAGGVISAKRIDNGLNLSRALGDFLYKSNINLPPQRQKVISVPDFVEHKLTGEQQFLFVGCDGVWQSYVDDTEGMVRCLRELRKRQADSEKMLAALLDMSLAPRISEIGCDNMTALIVQFDK